MPMMYGQVHGRKRDGIQREYIPGPKTKLCSQCKRMKLVSEFNPSKRSVDGYCQTCKTCQAKQRLRRA